MKKLIYYLIYPFLYVYAFIKKCFVKIVYALVFAYFYCIAGFKLWYGKSNKKRRLKKAIKEAEYKRDTKNKQYYVMPFGEFKYIVMNRDERKIFNKQQKRKGKKQFTDHEFSQIAVYKTKESCI